jgi:dihydroflavonol-4-reductase
MIPPGGINCVDVRDVAIGHLLAAEKGQRGHRYILGGENLTMAQVIHMLAPAGGLKPAWQPQVPPWLFGAFASFAEFRGWLRKREPYPSMQSYRLSRLNWYYSSELARAELGYQARPFAETLNDMHGWACHHGYPLNGKDSRKPWQDTARRAA